MFQEFLQRVERRLAKYVHTLALEMVQLVVLHRILRSNENINVRLVGRMSCQRSIKSRFPCKNGMGGWVGGGVGGGGGGNTYKAGCL